MSLPKLKGLGEKRIKILNDAGIYDLKDLCAFFPRKYYFDTELTPADFCEDGEFALLKARVTDVPITKYPRKGFNYTIIPCECSLSGVNFKVIYYNRPYLSQSIKQEEYLIFGQVSADKSIVVLNPVMENAQNPKQLKGVITIYNSIKGIPTNALREAIVSALQNLRIESILPEKDRQELGLIDLKRAYYLMHFPKDLAEQQAAAKTVAIEELVKALTVFWLKKNYDAKFRAFEYKDVREKVEEKIKQLPFELTQDQKTALDEIFCDLLRPRTMNRLIQGDVGSGKSIVAFLALYFVVLNGFQGVMMAPTEILARQHYLNLKALFSELNIAFLSSGVNSKERKQALERIKTDAQIIIGTHSLFQEGVVFKNPALAVIDEQQRFGVSQRKALEDKGKAMDILLLTATPIPRTLSLVLYGDLDISQIKTNPKQRAGAATSFVPNAKLQDMFDYIVNQAKAGIQTYIVAPKIEAQEYDDISVQSLYQNLKKKLKGVNLGFIHGKLKESQKNKIMQAFKDRKIDVLISTTVIEVGIDVPSAAIMVIFDAHKFGLSQLHQLRGRVGRGQIKGYCFLVANTKNPESLERLTVFKNNNDGFYLAEYDMNTRGVGDFLGTRQHGLAGVFNNLTIKPEWINIAKELSNKILQANNKDEILKKIELSNPRYKEILDNVTLN
ncbi:MAG TPA: ATP-dependent DNA helicase RecG [Clostridia bacterium]